MDKAEDVLSLNIHLNMDYDAALAKVAEALKAEGFGILTEIDVKETLKQKINVDFRRYKILGACNPPLAHRALTVRPEVGVLLPCNVTVAETEDGGTEVMFMNPLIMKNFVSDSEIAEIAQDVRSRISRIAAALEG